MVQCERSIGESEQFEISAFGKVEAVFCIVLRIFSLACWRVSTRVGFGRLWEGYSTCGVVIVLFKLYGV